MRAGRLLSLLLLLQNGGRLTAGELAMRLEVSRRTVLRDLDALSGAGVPVYALRGPQGGFALLDTFEQEIPPFPAGLTSGRGRLRRVRVRLSPATLRLALVLGKPEAWRPRPLRDDLGERGDWIEGSFRFDSYDTAIREILAIGPDIEVLLPIELRETMAAIGRRITELHLPTATLGL